MAQLFRRTGDRRFLLREYRDGVLWALRHRLHLGPKQENTAALTQALERKDAAAAKRFAEAARGVEELLTGPAGRARGKGEEAAAVRAARKLEQCL
jgi:hypothetical protein